MKILQIMPRNKMFTKKQENEICKKYFQDQLSARKVAIKFQCSYGTIRRVIKGKGLNLRTHSEAQIGKLNPIWRGGQIFDSQGYFLSYQPKHPYCTRGGYVCKHRLVMEKHLGRFLTSKEVVHHINGNLEDNHIENLCLFESQGEHMKKHSFGKYNRSSYLKK